MTDPNLSYAQALAATPSISPEEMLSELKKAYSKEDSRSLSEALKDALGISQQPHKNVSDTARKLAEHTNIICVDTESHTLNTDQMTELAIVQISYAQSSRLYQEGVGPHGRKLHKALDFMHFRIAEHAHLKSNRKNSLGPEGNRFGHSRWVTFEELRTILFHLFHRPVQSDDPELKDCLAPIMLVGHALKHDVENTLKPGLDFDITAPRTVVATIDTQKLAREGVDPIWSPPPGSAANEIGLRKLVEALDFEHTDDHTACNDAARTMMCAIVMVLEDKFIKNQSVTMQQVATEVENNSKTRPAMAYGTQLCCKRCGGRDHSFQSPACKAKNVFCKACHRFDPGAHRNRSAYSHIETYCDHVADFKAWLRRYKDATRKYEAGSRKSRPEVGNNLNAAAHPWSTWPVESKWPPNPLENVLKGARLVEEDKRYLEPPTTIENLESALGGFPVPPLGNFVRIGSLSSTAATSSTLTMAYASSASTTDPFRSASATHAPSTATGNAPPPAARTREVIMSDRRAHSERRGSSVTGRGGAQVGAPGAPRGSAARGDPPRGGTRGAGAGRGFPTQGGHSRVSSWDKDNAW